MYMDTTVPQSYPLECLGWYLYTCVNTYHISWWKGKTLHENWRLWQVQVQKTRKFQHQGVPRPQPEAVFTFFDRQPIFIVLAMSALFCRKTCVRSATQYSSSPARLLCVEVRWLSYAFKAAFVQILWMTRELGSKMFFRWSKLLKSLNVKLTKKEVLQAWKQKNSSTPDFWVSFWKMFLEEDAFLATFIEFQGHV